MVLVCQGSNAFVGFVCTGSVPNARHHTWEYTCNTHRTSQTRWLLHTAALNKTSATSVLSLFKGLFKLFSSVRQSWYKRVGNKSGLWWWANVALHFSMEQFHDLCACVSNTEVIRVCRVIIHLTSAFHSEILTKWCPQAANSRFSADRSLAAHYEYASCTAFISMALPPPSLSWIW